MNGEVNAETWQLMFVIPRGRVVAGLLSETPAGALTRIDGIVPADARFVRMFVEPHSQDLCVVLEHHSFKAHYEAQGVLAWSDRIPLLLARLPGMTEYRGDAVEGILAPSAVDPKNRGVTDTLDLPYIGPQDLDGGQDADSFTLNPGGQRA